MASNVQREARMPVAFLLFLHESGARLGLLWRVGAETHPRGQYWWRLELRDGRRFECDPREHDRAVLPPWSAGEVPFAWAHAHVCAASESQREPPQAEPSPPER